MTSEKTALVGYEKSGRIATMTLDDPPANTDSHEMMRELRGR